MTADLRKQVSALLEQYGDEIKETVQEVATEVGKESANIVRQKSAAHKLTGSYMKGWTSAVDTGKYGSVSVRIYNRTDWQLTHLLNNGFYSIRAGRRIDGDGHIDSAEEEINNLLVKKLEERLKQ